MDSSEPDDGDVHSVDSLAAPTISERSGGNSYKHKVQLSSDYGSSRSKSFEKAKDRITESVAARSSGIKEDSWMEGKAMSDNPTVPTSSISFEKKDSISKSRSRSSHHESISGLSKRQSKYSSYESSHKSRSDKKLLQEDLTVDSMRNKLFSSLKSRGLLENVKGQLRSSLTKAIKENTSLSEARKPQEKSMISSIVDSLIANHLRKAGYEYSLSVFQTESLDAKAKPNIHEILQFLKIYPSSPAYDKIIHLYHQSSSKGILWNILSATFSASDTAKVSVNTQTEEQLNVLLMDNVEQKMMKVEQEIYSKALRNNFTESNTLESCFLEFKRKLDIENKVKVTDEVKAFKTKELINMQLIVKEESRREIERLKKEMEKNYNEAFYKLKERQEGIEELLRIKRTTLDQEAFKDRQKMLMDIENLSQKENKMKQSHQIALKSVEVEEARLTQLAEQLRTKELTLKAAEERYESKLKDEILQMKLEQQEETQKKEEFFRNEEAKLLDEKRAFEYQKTALIRVRDQHDKLKDENSQLQVSLRNALKNVERFTIKAENLQEKLKQISDYDNLKQRSLILEKEVAMLRERVKDLQQEKETSTRKHDKTVKELLENFSKNTNVKDTNKDVEFERRQLLEQQTCLRDRCHTLEGKLKSEIIKNQELDQRHKENILQQKEMFREIEELKSSVRRLQRNNLTSNVRERKGLSSSSAMEGLVNVRRHGFVKHEESSTLLPIEKAVNNRSFKEVCSDASYNSTLGTTFVNETKDVFERLEREAMELEKSYIAYQQKAKIQERMSDKRPNTDDFTPLIKHDSTFSVISSEFVNKRKISELLPAEKGPSSHPEHVSVEKTYFVPHSTNVYELEQSHTMQKKPSLIENSSKALDRNFVDTWNGDYLTEQLLVSAINEKDDEAFDVRSQRKDDAAVEIANRSDVQNTWKLATSPTHSEHATSVNNEFPTSRHNNGHLILNHPSTDPRMPSPVDAQPVERKAEIGDTIERSAESPSIRKQSTKSVEHNELPTLGSKNEVVVNPATDPLLEKPDTRLLEIVEDEKRKKEQQERILAFERERKELERIENEEIQKKNQILNDDKDSIDNNQFEVPKEPTEILEDEENQEKNEQDNDEASIDPLMQHYMQLVLKKRQEEQEKAKESVNLTDDIKLESKISGNSDTSELFEHEIENNEEGSDEEFEW